VGKWESRAPLRSASQDSAGSPSEFIRNFDYSFDGKQPAIIRGHRESDVVLLRDAEK
jgi:hypothetical protein